MISTDRLRKLILLCAGLLFLCNSPSVVEAQFNPLFPVGPAEQPDPTLELLRRLPWDPLSETSLLRAANAIENGDVADGLEAFQSLLDAESDYFRRERVALTGSLHRHVESLLTEHLDDYERLYGEAAKQLYDQAVENQDLDGLAEVIRRFRMSKVGTQAVKMWSQAKASAGDPEAAAMAIIDHVKVRPREVSRTELEQSLRWLVESGHQSSAVHLIAGETPIVSGIETSFVNSLPTDTVAAGSDALLLHWTSPSGGPSQSGTTQFAPAMFSDAWVQPLIDQYDFFLGDVNLETELLEDARKSARSKESNVWSNSERTAFPAGRPLVVGNRVIVPGYGSIKSFNSESGEIDGVSVHIDQSFEYLHQMSTSPTASNDDFRDRVRQLFFALRGFRDLTSSSISTDGKYVYAVSDCQVAGSVNQELLVRSSQRHELLPQSFNQLHAYELNAGLRKRWSVGTVAEHAVLPFDPEDQVHRQIFFYGAPLAVDDQLYVIGEERGQIQLYELDQETGAVLWSIGLLNPKMEVTFDNNRRLSGMMPSYSHGLLICPTGEGVITAINPVSRQVVWSHQYATSRNRFEDLNRWRVAIRRQRSQTVDDSEKELIADERWFDAKIISIGTSILHTPPDSDELICVNLFDGKPVWETPHFRLRSHSLVASYNDNAILVGKRELVSIDTRNGKRNWSCSIPVPSGRGVRMGERFLQPLMTGEIAIIDLASGRQVTRSAMTGDRVIGNLVACDGRLYGQTATEIIAFESIDEINTQLAGTTSDAERKSVIGELELQREVADMGNTSLDQVAVGELTDRAKSALAWAKLDQLRADFVNHQEDVARIEQLITTDEQRIELLKTHALGLAESGNHIGAFERYLQLFTELEGANVPARFDGTAEISEQRWALTQLNDLYENIPTNEREGFDRAINNWIAEVDSTDALLEFLRAFPHQPSNLALVIDRLVKIDSTRDDRNVDAETQAANRKRTQSLAPALQAAWQKLAESELQFAAAAHRELALLALKLGDGATARSHLAELSTMEVVPHGSEKAAPEIAKEIRQDATWDQVFNAVPTWPSEIRESEQPNKFVKSPRFQIPVIGPQSLPLHGWTFFLNPMGSHIDVYDADGQRVSQVATTVISPRQLIGSTLARYVCMRGTRVLIVLADRFVLFDFQSDKEFPRLVAQQSLITPEQNPFGIENMVIMQGRGPEPGFRTVRSYSDAGTLAGNVGSIGASSLCFGVGETLTSIDPVTGKLNWRRFDLPMGSEIFADDEYVITLAPGTTTVNVYRAIDGEFVHEQALPEGVLDNYFARDSGDWGRLFPAIRRSESFMEFSMYDPAKNLDVWSFKAPAGTRWTCVEGSDLAFLSPDHTLTLVSAGTGETRLEKKLPFEGGPVESFCVLRQRDHWIVVPGKGRPIQYDFSFQEPLITRSIEKTVDGRLVALNRLSGEIVWTQDVDDQKILTQTPTNWPILFFGNSYGRQVKGVVLNSETGKEIVNSEWEYDRTWIHWQAALQPDMQIRIAYGRETVSLDCREPVTDESAN